LNTDDPDKPKIENFNCNIQTKTYIVCFKIKGWVSEKVTLSEGDIWLDLLVCKG
jgi:hypothetical protein